MRHELAVYTVAGLAVLMLAIVSVDFRHGPFFREDGIVEMTAALLFLAALLVGLHRQLFRTWIGFLFCSLALLACLSEISFGARHIGFSMPAMQGGGELDGVQDLVMIAYRTAAAKGFLPLVIGLVIILPVVTGLLAYRSGHLSRIALWFMADRGRPTLAVALLVIGLAVILDVMEALRFAEETLELFGAALFVTAALRLNRS
ncbi:hypothetical protein [Sphingorhabdus sp. Alg231-15]|uniref:hypothetical protein n=1 Tax=Sphingorhabdus sp. Alg231-15 TaxID=1922222 RepID=UPI00307C038E